MWRAAGGVRKLGREVIAVFETRQQISPELLILLVLLLLILPSIR